MLKFIYLAVNREIAKAQAKSQIRFDPQGKNIHIGMFSTGVSSAYACNEMVKEVGISNAYLMFTDTQIEDVDNYRFMREIVPVIMPKEKGFWHITHPYGTPWDIFDDQGYLGNDRAPLCSIKIKRELAEYHLKQVSERMAIKSITLWWGIDAEESHRADPIYSNWYMKFGIESRFPLIEQLTPHSDRFLWLKDLGIKHPRMYDLGFSHANCGGVCVRGGLNHFANLYSKWEGRYKEAERAEQAWQAYHKKENTILRLDGQNLSLKEYREEYLEPQKRGVLFEGFKDMGDGLLDGACACSSVYEGVEK